VVSADLMVMYETLENKRSHNAIVVIHSVSIVE